MVDLADPTATDALVDAVRPHVVFHLAAHVTGRREAAEVRPSVLNTLLASVNVLSSVTRVGCDRLVMAGSMEEPDTGISEAVAASPYAAAKWAASSHARMFHALHGTPAVILRLFMVYGPGQHDRTKLVPYVITSLLRGERPQVTSGSRLVDWVFVDDVVRAFIAAGAVSGVEGSTVDIGSGRTVTVRKVVESLIDLVDPDLGADFGAVPERPGEGSRAADVARAAATLGWHPSVVLEEGLAQTLRWYRQRDDGRGQLRSKIGSGR
jgi:nucleoside-diphosphate-sugar epimerase